jgi:hypothetical protein
MKEGFVIAVAIVFGAYITYKRFQHRFTPRQVENSSRRRKLLIADCVARRRASRPPTGKNKNALTVPG